VFKHFNNEAAVMPKMVASTNGRKKEKKTGGRRTKE